MAVYVRAFHGSRDFFGSPRWDCESVAEAPTVAEGLRLVSMCLRSMLGPYKVGACDAFRIEADAAPGGAPAPSMWLYSDAGFGVVKASRVVGGGVVGDPLLMDRAAVKKQVRGVLVTLLGDDRAEGLQAPAED